MEALTMDDLEGLRRAASVGSRRARSKNLLFKVSLLCLSTALCDALFSAVLTLFLILVLSFFGGRGFGSTVFLGGMTIAFVVWLVPVVVGVEDGTGEALEVARFSSLMFIWRLGRRLGEGF